MTTFIVFSPPHTICSICDVSGQLGAELVRGGTVRVLWQEQDTAHRLVHNRKLKLFIEVMNSSEPAAHTACSLYWLYTLFAAPTK